ncbi:replication-relaxation family protein [Yinghuangia sp. ASG 101]|uniref:replication-relaxation family protein n=1 Tax=Yinghuangia sp. ASG 101 TaxID=2896848 RepID=UPI001E42F78B|nr:replication-relaxation family protein [Yinghuangia sp. ASG 101]UGQ13602.1 replication-relaxation family protein [Yinghuangia sp. ASG 101]
MTPDTAPDTAAAARPPVRAAAAAAQLAGRLTARDWWLIEMLHTHRVLTSTQILRLAYTARRTANARLRRLADHGVLDTFRPLQPTGSAPAHWVLGPAGAAVLAARRGTTVRELPWRGGDMTHTAHSTRLAHTVEANEVMVRLAAEHRTHPGRELLLWLPPHTCAHLWGDWIRPDAYGLHHDTTDTAPGRAQTAHAPRTRTRAPEPAPDPAPDPVPGVPEEPGAYPVGRVTGFFLEYDRGTEPAWRVAAKLDGYAAHAAGTRTRTPVLIHTPTPAREHLLRTRLAATAADLDLPVATTSAHLTPAAQPAHLTRYDHDTYPTAADPVWHPLTPTRYPAARHHGGRLRLADLAEHFGPLTPALDTTTPDADAYEPAPDWTAVPPLPPSAGGTP